MAKEAKPQALFQEGGGHVVVRVWNGLLCAAVTVLMLAEDHLLVPLLQHVGGVLATKNEEHPICGTDRQIAWWCTVQGKYDTQ